MQNMKAGAAAILVACCAPVVHAQTPQPKVIHNLPVSEAALVQENTGSGRVTGVLTNTSGCQLQSVVVQFSLLDDQGTQIGTATAAAMGVAEGGKWRFAAPYSGTTGNVASAKLGDIMAVTQP
ncbi:FxLYD domain-containing protein [Paraburkholderia nemoris]|uniref:FxLYD domain-containing protein n=1 Tax=Paraburkholderia nemoris TaxID=2793076 RepID=UPI0038B86D75